MMSLQNLIENLRIFLGGDDLFEMANFLPKDTGLPYPIWVSHKGRARHSARIKAYPEGYKVKDNVVVISIDENPKVLEKPIKPKLPSSKINKVVKYVRENHEILLRYWEDENMGTPDLFAGLKRSD